MSEVTAYVTTENGQLILHDPAAEGMVAAIEKHNRDLAYESCRKMLELNADGVERFKQRFAERSYDPRKHCIVIIQVDDPYGGPISKMLMPNADDQWRAMRAQGLEPVARGIADRNFMHSAIAAFDRKADDDNDMLKDKLVTIVVANGVARVFET